VDAPDRASDRRPIRGRTQDNPRKIKVDGKDYAFECSRGTLDYSVKATEAEDGANAEPDPQEEPSQQSEFTTTSANGRQPGPTSEFDVPEPLTALAQTMAPMQEPPPAPEIDSLAPTPNPRFDRPPLGTPGSADPDNAYLDAIARVRRARDENS
jgi:hypothetical protein